LILLLLIACPPGGGFGIRSVEGEDTSGAQGASLPGGGGGKDEPEKPDEDFGCSTLFAQDRLPLYEVTIDEDDWQHLEREWRTLDGTKDYVPIGELKIDGEVVPEAMIRLKGNNGCCWVGEKMQFVVAFNEVDEDSRVEGMRKVAFDAPYYDPSVLRNRLANWFLHRGGLAGTCTNNAELRVNGEYQGLYAHMEELDHEFLERNFGKTNADGDLWKYGYILDNHEDEDVDSSRMELFWSSYDPSAFTQLGESDQWLREWAAEAVLPDGDGYWCCGHNYYLYDHPERGFLWVPWDKDGTFDWVAYDLAPDTIYYPANTPHLVALLGREDDYARYLEHVAELTELYGSDEMLSAYVDMRAQTESLGLVDPLRYYDDDTYLASLDSLGDYLGDRRRYLDAWLAVNRP
jgi:hypothetical protein